MPSKSKKQAKLMAAVAHNPKFAKKVGIPQSVGREFNNADQRRGFADGGKVKTLKRLSKLLRDRYQMDLRTYGEYGENIPEYNKIISNWDPEMSAKDADLITDYGTGALWKWEEGADEIQRMDELIRKHGIRPRDFTLWRGMEISPDRVDTLKAGSYLSSPRQTSTSLNQNTAIEFSTMGAGDPGAYPTVLRIAPTEKLALPIPVTGQSELVFPSGEAGRLLLDRVKYNPRSKSYDIDAIAEPHPGFAGGGEVLPSSQDEEEPWTDTYVKRPLSGLASMWGGTDPETGEFVSPAWHNLKRAWDVDERRRKGLPPQERSTLGIVDETLSLPALGGIVGLPVPEFASEAEERASSTRGAARETMGLDAPHGFAENIAESAGVMAGQLPVPAGVANKLKLLKESGKLGKAGKVLGPAAEWFSPTVVPKVKNYLQGTLFGGLLGGGLDYLEDKEAEERNKQFISEAVAEVLEEERLKRAEESGDEVSDEEALTELGYAEGGKVSNIKRLISRATGKILNPGDKITHRNKSYTIDRYDPNINKIALKGIDHRSYGWYHPDEIEVDAQEPSIKRVFAEGGKVSIAHRSLSALRKTLEESDDPVLRQAKIDEALKAINTPGTVELPKTIRAGLNEQRDPAGISMLVDRALPLLQPARVGNIDPKNIVSNIPPPAPVRTAEKAAQDTAHGTMADEVLERLLRRVGYHDRGANRPLAEEMMQMEQDDLDWEKMSGYAEGGEVVDPRGAPLSQGWYENYGAGPEHLFLGDRTVKLPDYWAPQHPGAVPPVQQESQGSWLPGVGIVGLSLYDEWKKRRGEGQDASQQAFWNDMHASAANTSNTDAWVNQQLDQYGNNAPMPVMGDDGTVSYVQPDKFWRDLHDSAVNTSDTDAWVNSQLENYNAPMPVVGDDGTISYVNAQGEPVESGGLNLGRAWQGVGGAYDAYSGLQAGDAQGYIQALQGANDLYGAYTGTPGFGGAAGAGIGALSGLSSIYGGIQEGGARGYSQAASGVSQTAQQLGYNNGAVGALGTAASVAGALYSAYGAYESAKVGDKKGAVAQGAAAGAAIGSVVPVIGTAVGAVVGAVVGLVGASLGNKQMASEAYYGAHKKLKPDEVIRNWGEDQVNGAVFETIKSHTKSGNIKKFQDVGEMYTAFGITKDAHKNYKNVQNQMGEFIKGVVQTAQQMGALPTDPMALKQLDGQQIYYKVVVPALAAKYKEATGKDSQAWTTDKINPEAGSQMHSLMADWTDWMTGHWGDVEAKSQPRASTVDSFNNDPRSGALSALQ